MKPFIALTLAMSLPVIATAQTASQKDIEAILEQQQKQIEALQKQLKQTQTQIEMTADAIDEASSNQSASSGSSKTHIGGYGELHYNNIENAEKIDFHRFVLFIDHEFSSDIRFVSELELEHSLAGDGKPGEVELEQAYIEMDLSDTSSFKAGLFLMPIGILNETHEPNTFYGVERNPVEGNIIPTTWWEAGVGYTTRFAEGWSADFSIHSGLNVDPAVYSIRGGRQKVANANADSLAYTARLKYTAIPGLEIAASYQIQDDLTQGLSDASADLFSAHLVYNTGNFTIRTLY
ncbi:MAG: porin, partial [Gammaproteobacteria bacterium]|nr:porin [Gammaproteobacteria bacterium]